MSVQYRCGTATRRRDVAASRTLNGIDFLEVAPGQTTLLVTFLRDLGGSPALAATEVAVLGGVRITGVQVISVTAAGRVLTVTTDRPGDFSTYRLVLGRSAEDPRPPAGFDVQLSQVEFSFKAGCATDLDCPAEPPCEPAPVADAEIDYLAKDYTSFRQLMLDRMAVLAPAWQDRNPADLGVALVELLAYVGDQLSYFQDSVATEAYLGTARRRVSLRRHARLLDYRLGEGCSARVWLHFGASVPVLPVPAATRVSGADQDAAVVFETMHDVTARAAHNRISLYTWGEEACCLPAGATRATLRRKPGLALQPGDALLFEEVLSPTTGGAAGADAGHRQVVRLTAATPGRDDLYGVDVLEVEWAQADTLAFPFCVTAIAPDPSNPDGPSVLAEVGVARGNLALADHGRTVGPEPLDPPVVPDEGAYRPHLLQTPLTFRVPLAAGDLAVPAAGALAVDPARALPAVTLAGDGATWTPQYDLLASDRFAAEFVVETETDLPPEVRFGDGVHGRPPAPGSELTAAYRVGTGIAGNVGREVLTRVDGLPGLTVRNPMPAAGGAGPESLEHVRVVAPQAFRTQERAVTPADYAAIAERHPKVQRANAAFRWTGSWYAVSVSVDRLAGAPVDEAFRAELTAFLDGYRMAGFDVEVHGPVLVPIDLALRVCVEPGHFRAHVEAGLLQALGTGRLPGGSRGFFHPDNLTFGQPVFLSQVYRAALAVAGVAWVQATRFQRWGRTASAELGQGVLRLAPQEVARLDNDPNFPENGRLQLSLEGGL